MAPTIATDADAAATQRETLADIREDGEAAVLRFAGAGGMDMSGDPSGESPVDVELHVLRSAYRDVEPRPGVQIGDSRFLIAYLALGALAPPGDGGTTLDDEPGATGFSIFVNESDPTTHPDPAALEAREFEVIALESVVREKGFPILYRLQGRG